MMATVPHVTSGLGLRKFQADGFLLTGVYTRKFIFQQLLHTFESVSQCLYCTHAIFITSN